MTFKKSFVSWYSLFLLAASVVWPLFVQGQDVPLSNDQIVERAYPAVALVLTGRTPGQTAAVVVRQNGILLTAYHVVKDAYAVQVRFKSGEIFDQVQLLGVDPRRDVAAIKIIAAALPALPVAVAAQAKAGESVFVVSHPASLSWSASSGVISAFRIADEIPGAGNGYRLIQFTAPSSPGSSGGVVIDARGNALGLVVGSLSSGQNLNFAIPIDSVIGLADTAPTKSFASGSNLNPPANIVAASPQAAPAVNQNENYSAAEPEAPEKSDLLSASKDRDFIVRNFKTMYIDASRAQYFGSDQLKAALSRNKDFAKLNIRIVDDRKVADTVLDVKYTLRLSVRTEAPEHNHRVVSGQGRGAILWCRGRRQRGQRVRQNSQAV